MGKLIDDRTKKAIYFDVVEEISRVDGDRPNEKTLVLQRLRFRDDGKERIRLGYYVNKGKGNTWGQYCTMLPTEDFQELVNEARRRGWIA